MWKIKCFLFCVNNLSFENFIRCINADVGCSCKWNINNINHGVRFACATVAVRSFVGQSIVLESERTKLVQDGRSLEREDSVSGCLKIIWMCHNSVLLFGTNMCMKPLHRIDVNIVYRNFQSSSICDLCKLFKMIYKLVFLFFRRFFSLFFVSLFLPPTSLLSITSSLWRFLCVVVNTTFWRYKDTARLDCISRIINRKRYGGWITETLWENSQNTVMAVNGIIEVVENKQLSTRRENQWTRRTWYGFDEPKKYSTYVRKRKKLFLSVLTDSLEEKMVENHHF